MDHVEELVAEARHLVNAILNRAAGRLLAGTTVRDVVPIVHEAARCLEDVELYALIAVDANVDAETAIGMQIERLRELERRLNDDQGP